MNPNTDPLSFRHHFARRMTHWAVNGNLGYDQHQRNNFYEGGETDCSKFVIDVLNSLGFNTRNATYTGNMRDNLTMEGWVEYPVGTPLEEGDILLNHIHHVAVYVGDGFIAEASLDENEEISGGLSGDQTGNETRVVPYRDYPWDCVLRFEGNIEEKKDNEMILITRIEDGKHYLMVGTAVGEIDTARFEIFSFIGVKSVSLYNSQIYQIMETIHQMADNEHQTARVYDSVRKMANG